MSMFPPSVVSSSGFLPHGHSYLWAPGVVWLHVISDALIVLACCSMPVSLICFVRKRRDSSFGAVSLCVAIFILTCGVTHLMEIWNVWHASYWLSGGIKALTAAAAVPAAILLARRIPGAIAAPSAGAVEREIQTLRLATQAAGIGAFDWNVQSGSNTWTPELEAMYGLKPGEFGRTQPAWENLVHPEDRNSAMALVHRAFETFAPQQGEWRVVWPDGTVHWIAGRFQVFKDKAGKPLRLTGVNLDITERKQAEAARRESDERMRLATEATAVGIWEWNILTHRIRWDAQMFRIYGIPPTPDGFVNYETWSGAVLPEDLREQEEQLQETVRLRGRGIRQFRIARPDDAGKCRHIEAVETVRTDERGQAEWVVGTNLDITERKRAEEEIRTFNAELEGRVAERTSQLEAANNELEAFSYSVSHDLRAPLRAVDGFSQAVLEDYGPQLPEECQAHLRTIRGGAQRMGMLIDDLLTFSRLSRSPLHKQEVNTGGMVRSVLDDLGPQQEGRQIDLRIGDLPDCAGDPAMLKQVWINLLSNALKYTQRRENVVVEIGCEQKPEGSVYFIRDNGTGFDMRYAGKLFGVFQRLHLAEEYEGTGVGLALVQRIIHRHGGRVWAEAEVDRGATFFFTLENNPQP